MFAFLTIDPARTAALVTNLLAVGGGFLAGYFGTAAAAFFADRWLTRGRTPAGFKKVVARIGGVTGALLVAFLVFGSGGGGLGGGKGEGAGSGAADPTPGGAGPGTGPGRTDPSARAPAEVTPPPVAPEPAEETLAVTVLSGADVKDEKFYRVGPNPTPRTLAEVKDIVAGRPKGGKPLAIDIRLAARTDRNNSGVLDLEAWAREAGMRVILPKKD